MALPKAVEEAGKRSEEALRKAEQDAQHQDQTPPEDEPPVDPPANQPGPSGEDTQELREQFNKLQDRFNVLQGKYNAEVRGVGDARKLREENDQLQQQITNLQSEMQELREQATQADPSLDKLREEFGEDHVLLQALKEMRETVARQDKEIRQLRGASESAKQRADETATQAQKRAEDTFWRDLSTAVPDWGEINEQMDFREWLGETDRYTGMTRQALLDRAHQNLDAERVAAFFTDFKEHRQSNKKPSMDDNLRGKEHPSGAGGGEGEQKKVWTRQEISDFFSTVTADMGKPQDRRTYTDEQARELEADIMKAQSEGRVR